MRRGVKLKPVPRLSLEGEKRRVLDDVDALLLRRISETNSLTESARASGISYRNAWDRIKRMELGIGRKVLETKTGGPMGGTSRLTSDGLSLLKQFRSVRKYLFSALDERDSAANVGYKLSTRNRIGARITSIERGDVASMIKMVNVEPVSMTSIISTDAVDDLGLHEGDYVQAIIKSTEVMVAKPTSVTPRGNRRNGKPK